MMLLIEMDSRSHDESERLLWLWVEVMELINYYDNVNIQSTDGVESDQKRSSSSKLNRAIIEPRIAPDIDDAFNLFLANFHNKTSK